MDALPFDMEQLIAEHPTWELINAYERTKIVCAAFTRAAQSIPSWTTVRTLIGKGSPQDINRGKDDYRMQLAEELKALSKMPSNVPESLSQLLLTVWTKAVEEASTQFNVDRAQLAQHIEQLNHDVSFKNDALDQSKATIDAQYQNISELKSTIDALRLANDQLQQQVAADAQARAEIQSLYDDALAKSNQAQASLNDAITRLEGVENHMLMRIEETKAEHAAKLAALEATHQRRLQELILIEAKLNRDVSAHQATITRLNDALQVAEAKLAQTEKVMASLQRPTAPSSRKRGLRPR